MSVLKLRPKKCDPLYCSFCGKERDEVAYLVAGSTVFICDECVELCREIGTKTIVMNVLENLPNVTEAEGRAMATGEATPDGTDLDGTYYSGAAQTPARLEDLAQWADATVEFFPVHGGKFKEIAIALRGMREALERIRDFPVGKHTAVSGAMALIARQALASLPPSQ